MIEPIPPIHDVVRFWRRSEAATIAACVEFRKKPLPGWTLRWLRESAHLVMTRKITLSNLQHAVREKVHPDAQVSVLKAVELFWGFAEKHQWSGRRLSALPLTLPSGTSISVTPVGRYISTATNSEWVVAIQPRQDEPPDDEQFSMWRSALFYKFCTGNDEAMIIDLSKNRVSQKREIHEITRRKHKLMDLLELEERLDQVVGCYRKAVELVPERPKHTTNRDTDQNTFDF